MVGEREINLLFICGSPHSGTSLLLSIFGSTPGVAALTNETGLLLKMSVQEFRSQLPRLPQPTELVVEKTPAHVFALEKICCDPQSKALITVRNPVDVVASMRKRGIALNEAIDTYYSFNKEWLRFESSDSIYVQRYEDLTENPHRCLKKLSQQFGLNLITGNVMRLDSQQIYFSGHGLGPVPGEFTDGLGHRNHLALRNHQMKQPIKRMNGEWRGRINKEELSLTLSKLRPIILTLGYHECFDYPANFDSCDPK